MKTIQSTVAMSLLGLTLLVAVTLPARAEPKKANDSKAGLIAEGQRIVENVGLCADCHARRLPSGEFDRAQWLQGALLSFQPTVKMPWSADAPAISGLPGYNEEQAVQLLTTGKRANGVVLRPPMPA
jgi:mono/diheme cytochrome c family protein